MLQNMKKKKIAKRAHNFYLLSFDYVKTFLINCNGSYYYLGYKDDLGQSAVVKEAKEYKANKGGYYMCYIFRSLEAP